MELEGETYQDRVKHQLEEWVKGNPIHNKQDDECCPDFSCCKPEMLQPDEVRKTFGAANREQQEGMLFSFLGAAVSEISKDKNIQIIDGKNEINSKLN